MKFIALVLFAVCGISMYAQFDTVFTNFPESNSLYIDENIPGEEPQEFLSNFIDFEKHHIHSAPMFTPDMQEMYFSLYLNYDFPQRIFCSKKTNNKWTKPKLVSFSGKYQEGRPTVSPDGNRIYYYSKRPKEGTEPRKNIIIWFVNRQDDNTWSEPNYLRMNHNDSCIYVPLAQTTNNELYFISGINGQHPQNVFIGKVDGNKLNDIKKCGEPFFSKEINSSIKNISSDGKKLIYWRIDLNSTPRRSLYITEKNENNEWSKPNLLNQKVIEGDSRFPCFSKDNKYFFFSSYRSGVERWYWINANNIY
jgi:WD40-like Beta Propeller Repeat